MFEFDPERALWKPGRRSFLSMFGAALVAPMLPQASGWASGEVVPLSKMKLITSELVTRELALSFAHSINWSKKLSISYGKEFGPYV